MHSGCRHVFSHTLFPMFSRSLPNPFLQFFLSFLHLSIYECRLESSRGRTGEYKMRGCEKWCDVSPYLVTRSWIRVNDEDVPLCQRVARLLFVIFMFITEVSYHKICFIYTNARAVEGARGGSLARYINTSRKTAKYAPNLGKATCVLPENPYILHQKTMRIRDSLKVRGQRIHVSTLIQ